MKNKIIPPYLRDLDLSLLNDIIIDIYKHLSRIADSADEITFRPKQDGTRELILREGRGELVDVSNTIRFSSNSSSIKTIVQGKLKEDLELDKVTNESKATMFTNPSFTGDDKLNTSTSNTFKFNPDDEDNNTLVDVVTALKSPIIRFMSGATPRWKIGFDTDDTINKFKIDNGTGSTLADPSEFELDNSGNLELAGTIKASISSVGSDTDKFLVSDSGTVKYRTGAEVLSDIGAGAVAGSSSIVTTGALDAGSITSGFGAIDNGSSNITTTGTISGGTITGSVIWQSFPFYALTLTHSRYYYIDVDDTANSLRRWDDYDVDPTGFNYRDVAGQFVVPENCTLKGMHGVISNQSSTNNPTIGIYHGTVTEGTGDTTLALAAGAGGAAKTVTISTLRVPYKFNDTYSVNLDAGDIIVPTIYHADSGGTRTFQGSLTLKFITR
tara:strand:+ start:8536 stop:9858 length:1323 start_codon:yes stop_codon:yes gene_type:complete